MAKIINSTFVSLDGVINHMERWHFDFVDDESGAFALEQLNDSDAMLMGRRTYETYAQAWPGRQGEYPDRINAVPKYVVSSTLKKAEWNNSTIVDGDIVEAATKLKQDQNILMHGYGPVAKTLMRHDLVDELVLWVHPALAGVGDAEDVLMSPGLTRRLSLVDVKTFGSGVVILRYHAG